MHKVKHNRGKTIGERFWARVQKTEGCWLWVGSCGSHGHGHFMHERKRHSAHRLSYELSVGPIPDGLVLDHLCRNTACVRPDHLEPVTSGENVRRGFSPSGVNLKKTHCIRGHPLSGDNLVVYANKNHHPMRQCRICLRAMFKRMRERKLADAPQEK